MCLLWPMGPLWVPRLQIKPVRPFIRGALLVPASSVLPFFLGCQVCDSMLIFDSRVPGASAVCGPIVLPSCSLSSDQAPLHEPGLSP